jgi:glycosyltransferase involved in cell wall biosynthesis
VDQTKKPLNFLSVIIPIYNGRKYLNELCKEIFQLVKLGAEIIIVDDGSSDNTFTELKRTLSSQVTNGEILLLNQGHQGPGIARNYGLKAARREFVAFWDADDMRLIGEIVQIESHLAGTDIVITAFEILNLETGEKIYPTLSVDNWKDDLSLNGGLWRLFIRRSFVAELEFTSSFMGEDLVFLSQLIAQGPRTTFYQRSCYVYTKGSENQLTRGKVNMREARNSIQALVLVLDDLSELDHKVVHRFIVKLFITVLRSRHLSTICGTLQILLRGSAPLVIVRLLHLLKAFVFLAKNRGQMNRYSTMRSRIQSWIQARR